MGIKKDLAIIGLFILVILLGAWGWNNGSEKRALENSLEVLENKLEAQVKAQAQAVDSIQGLLTSTRHRFWQIKKDLESLEAEKERLNIYYDEKDNIMDLNLDAAGWARLLSRSANNYRNRRQDPPPAD